jgi:hypothetical protein
MLHLLGRLALLAGSAWAASNPEGAFNHKRHATLKMACATCHAGAASEERAGFPAARKQCRTCHTEIDERKIPAARVYRLRDFVIFSHARHVAGSAKLDCANCHGAVYQADELKVERPTTMIACVNCHKEHKATVVCTACHELGQ